MFTIYDGKVYKVNGNKLVGVDITPTDVKEVKGEEIKSPKLTNILTLREVKIKFGGEYKFPVKKKAPAKKKVDKDDATTKTKKSTGKSK